jgi:hypothetical protein
MPTEQFSNDAITTLAATIAASDTSLTVANNLGFPTVPQFRIRIDNEILLVTGVSGATWTVTRAAEPVSGLQLASAHAAGASVTHVLTGASIAGLVQVTDSVALNAGVLSLVNDASSPGNFKYYGTDGSGTLGYYDVSGGSGMSIGGPISGATSGSVGNGLLYADNASPGLMQQTVDVKVTPANDGTGHFAIDNSVVASPSFAIHFLSGANFGIEVIDSFVAYQVYIGDFFDGACLVAIDYAGNQAWLCDGTNALRIVGPSFLNGDVGFGGATPQPQQTGGAATAGAAWTATEQQMLNAVYSALRTFGLLS